MTHHSRRLLFSAAVILFVCISYIAILYAQGYKYSFTQSHFIRTGAISLKVNTDAKVFVNDKLAGRTAFLSDSFGIDRLLPGSYVIRVQKDAYSSWQKNITVEEGRLSEFSKIMLLPTDEEETVRLVAEIKNTFAVPEIMTPTPSPRVRKASPTPSVPSGRFSLSDGNLTELVDGLPVPIATDVLGYMLSDNNHKLLWWKNQELWVLWLDDTNYQPFHQRADLELITRSALSIARAAWFRDEDHIVFDAGGYKVVEIDTRGGINIIKI